MLIEQEQGESQRTKKYLNCKVLLQTKIFL